MKRNKREIKLYSKLEELKILNSDISKISKKRLNEAVSDWEQKIKIEHLPFVPTLHISHHSSNSVVSEIKDRIKKIEKMENKLKESKPKIDDNLKNIISQTDILEFKSKVFEAKIKAHSEAIRSLEK